VQAGSEPLSAVAGRANSDRHRNAGKYRLLIVISLLVACFLLTYTFHFVLNSGSLFSHFFYIPIVLSAFWWKRKGLIVSIVLGLYLIFSHRCCLDEEIITHDDYLISLMFVVTALIVAMLSERIQKTEGKVRESEARYRSMFEHMSDGVAVLGAVENGRDFVFLDVNGAAEKIDGRSRERLLGNSLLEVSPRDKGLIGILRRVWETGGAETWIDGFHANSRIGGWRENSAYKLPSGEVVVVFSDKTEQKQAEQKAIQLASLVESSDAAIISMSLDGEILSWNSGATRVYGYEPEVMLGECILTLVPSDHWETMLQRIDDMKNGEKRDHYETLHVNKDGEQIDMSIVMSPLKDLHGNVLGASFIGRNIMRRKEAERALQRAYEQLERKVEERTAELATANEELRKEIAERERVDKALKESSEKIKLFAYLICHDLKSPSIGIYGLARLLRNQYGGILDEKGRAYCEQILKASEQVGALVEKINTYIATKESPLNMERVELREIFETIRAEFSEQLSTRNIEFTGPDAPAEVNVDRLSLLRVITNLVDNALKYGGERLSEVRLGYEESEDFHVFSVRDDGVGVKSEDVEKIFGLFQRISASKGVEGSGLGLAIVKEAAERHGGRVWVESGPGRGTTFFVSISKILD
jgi:PAS domain S-box-containing protein